MRIIRKSFIIILFIYFFLCSALYILQRDLLYFPTPIHNHHYKSALFKNDGEIIDVITLNIENKPAILFFGGNGESVVLSASAYKDEFPNHAIYLVNYRGYGRSSGYPTEEGIYSDALHIFDKIKEKHANISVVGRSLGTGVATYIAANRHINKMVLITPYDSIENIASAQYPAFPVSLLLKDKYRSIERIHKIKAETLILLAEYDNVIPLKNSLSLIEKFDKNILTIKTIKGTGHNSISSANEYYPLMHKMIDVELNLTDSTSAPEQWRKVRLLFVRGNAEPDKKKTGKHDWAVFLTTDIALEANKILEIYVLRWAVEVYFKEAKQHLGFLKEQSNHYAAYIASIHLAAIRFCLLSIAKQSSGAGLPETRHLLNENLTDINFAARFWQVFRAVISGALNELEELLGDAVILVMKTIEKHMNCFFVQALQLM